MTTQNYLSNKIDKLVNMYNCRVIVFPM